MSTPSARDAVTIETTECRYCHGSGEQSGHSELPCGGCDGSGGLTMATEQRDQFKSITLSVSDWGLVVSALMNPGSKAGLASGALAQEIANQWRSNPRDAVTITVPLDHAKSLITFLDAHIDSVTTSEGFTDEDYPMLDYAFDTVKALEAALSALAAPAADAEERTTKWRSAHGVLARFADAGTGKNVVPIKPERYLGHCAEAHLKWGAISQDDLMDAEFGPKEDSLEAAIAECEANGWGYSVEVFPPVAGDRPWGKVRVPDGTAYYTVQDPGETPLLALRAAMSRAAERPADGGEG